MLAHLTSDIDLWLATGSARGGHLVPLSFVWHGDRVVMVTAGDSLTVANLRAVPRARAALGATRDVVVVDGPTRVMAMAEASDGAVAAFAGHTGWDPSDSPGYVVVELTPERILAWREENELAGRTILRDGAWLV